MNILLLTLATIPSLFVIWFIFQSIQRHYRQDDLAAMAKRCRELPMWIAHRNRVSVGACIEKIEISVEEIKLKFPMCIHVAFPLPE